MIAILMDPDENRRTPVYSQLSEHDAVLIIWRYDDGDLGICCRNSTKCAEWEH